MRIEIFGSYVMYVSILILIREENHIFHNSIKLDTRRESPTLALLREIQCNPMQRTYNIQQETETSKQEKTGKEAGQWRWKLSWMKPKPKQSQRHQIPPSDHQNLTTAGAEKEAEKPPEQGQELAGKRRPSSPTPRLIPQQWTNVWNPGQTPRPQQKRVGITQPSTATTSHSKPNTTKPENTKPKTSTGKNRRGETSANRSQGGDHLLRPKTGRKN